VNVLIVTDAFPPICGGSGWSTYELARGLRARGHAIVVVQPRPGTTETVRETSYDDLRVLEVGAFAPAVPYVRNYFKNERLYARLTSFLESIIDRERIDIIHGQHVMTGVPAIAAGRSSRIPAICTVRDYWPVCYWSDLIHTRDEAHLCPECSVAMMTRCIRPRAGAAWPLALPMIPYMRANLSRKRADLARADAVIAVSTTIAADLRVRAPELAGTPVHVIPNPVNLQDLRARAAALPSPIAGPYALYLGKLAPNKGTSHLVSVAERAALDWPLAIVGAGPEQELVAGQAARSGHDIRMIGWVDQQAAAAWLAHASLLVFTSRGPESLSRVLIEASALGIPIAAMKTGGTPDIVMDEETGLLSETPEELAADVGRLRGDEPLRKRLGGAAMARADALFDARATTERIERVYQDLLDRRAR
jgi:glycosyltransferase involved in cell wall biosynthesis